MHLLARISRRWYETSLILRTVFHQPLRQTEGLVGSLLELMGLDLPVPDHSTLSRRSRTLTVALQAQSASGPVHLLVDSTGVKLSGRFCQLSGQVVRVPDSCLPEVVSGGGDQVSQRSHALDMDGPPTGERNLLVDVGSRTQEVADLVEGSAEAIG